MFSFQKMEVGNILFFLLCGRSLPGSLPTWPDAWGTYLSEIYVHCTYLCVHQSFVSFDAFCTQSHSVYFAVSLHCSVQCLQKCAFFSRSLIDRYSLLSQVEEVFESVMEGAKREYPVAQVSSDKHHCLLSHHHRNLQKPPPASAPCCQCFHHHCHCHQVWKACWSQ